MTRNPVVGPPAGSYARLPPIGYGIPTVYEKPPSEPSGGGGLFAVVRGQLRCRRAGRAFARVRLLRGRQCLQCVVAVPSGILAMINLVSRADVWRRNMQVPIISRPWVKHSPLYISAERPRLGWQFVNQTAVNECARPQNSHRRPVPFPLPIHRRLPPFVYRSQ